MIVICTGCQARFRVADEKIGPRGAKVRCTRCQNVFLVQREAAPPPTPAIDLDLTPGLGRPAPARDPFAPSAAGAVIPFPGAGARAGSPAPDPFVAAGIEGLDGSAAIADDPFAPLPAKQPSVKFPAAELGASGAPGPGSAMDPFAAADPFAPAAPSATTGQSLPVTDLAQLLGGAAGVPAATPPPRPPPPAPPPAAMAPAEPAPAFAAFGEDLTLEERKDSEPAPAAPASFADPDDVFAADPGATSFAAAFPPGVFDDALPSPASGDESLSLATEKTPAPAGVERSPSPPSGEPTPPRPPPRPAPELAEADVAAAASHLALGPRSRLRSAAVNALALVALVAVALGIRAVLLGDAKPGPGALRPSRLLEAFGGSSAPAPPFEVAEVRTGVYPQVSGGSVLFVRGVVICRAPVAGGVKIAAELVRDGQVLARGDVLAGAVPTPEDVWKAGDRTSLDALAAELGKRAPQKVGVGDRLAFLVTLGDAPAELHGTSVRLQAGEAPR